MAPKGLNPGLEGANRTFATGRQILSASIVVALARKNLQILILVPNVNQPIEFINSAAVGFPAFEGFRFSETL
jgi:hypothetical protein